MSLAPSLRAAVPPRVLGVAVLVVTLSTQPVFLLGAAFVSMGPELGYGPRGLGMLTGLFFLTSAASSAPLGRVVARVGWRAAVRFNAAASGAVVLSIATVAHDVTTLAALLVCGAVVYGLSNPAANAALAAHGDPRRRALLFGLKHAGIPGSTLLAGLAVPTLVVTLGWRSAYAAAAVIAVVVWVLVPGYGAGSPRESPQDDGPAPGAPLTLAHLVGLAAGSAFATWGPIALSTYLVAAAVDGGFGTSAAGLLLFAGSSASIAARVVAGAVTDRVRGRGFAGVSALAACGAVLFLLLPPSSGAAFAAVTLAAFATGWGWPGLMTFTVVNANSSTVAASSAITQSGVFLGAGVGPLILGALVARYGFDAAWWLAAAGLATAAIGVTMVGARTKAVAEAVARTKGVAHER